MQEDMREQADTAEMLAEAERLRRRDLAVLWHPCTQMAEHPDLLPFLPIRRGRGAWLEGVDGRRYLDAISSWWTNLFGHAEPRIAAAIARQARELEHVIFAGFGHEPALRLAEGLLRVAPKGLARVFYADNGSAAIEVALKMSFHSFLNRGQPAHEVHRAAQRLPRRNHRRAVDGRHPAVPAHLRAAAAAAAVRALARRLRGRAGRIAEACALRRADELEAIFEANAGEICALVLEPLVQCAGGMRMHHPAYLRRARELCDAHGAHLIADEIAVGFGRTGTLFACEQARSRPTSCACPRALPAASCRCRPCSPPPTLRGLPGSGLARARLPAFAQLHRQSLGLRGGAGFLVDFRNRAGARAQPRDCAAHGGAGGAAWPPTPERRRGAPDRDDPRDRAGRRQGDAHALPGG
jgi:adenosylmethionine-8-amino-7-oxononanoate aminotransferase